MKKKANNLKLNFGFEPEYKTFKIEDLDIQKQINDAKRNWNTYLKSKI